MDLHGHGAAPISYALGRIWDTAIGLGVGWASTLAGISLRQQQENPGHCGEPGTGTCSTS